MKDEIIFTPFYLSFTTLCKRDGITPTEAAKRAGISSGAPTAWKAKGAIPKPEQRKKLCSLFSVTDEELLGYEGQKEKPTPVSESGPKFPPAYELLTPENRAKADSYLEFLLASQQNDQT